MGNIARSRLGIVGVVLAAYGCGGHTTATASIHDTAPPTTFDGGGRDSRTSDAAVFDGGSLTPSSGTRLTILEPTTPEYTQLWDEQKNVACTPQRATDGTERCLPSGGTLLYADSSCSRAVIRGEQTATCGAAPGYYADTGGGGACPDRTAKLYSMGLRIDPPPELYPHNSAPCALFDESVAPDPSATYYEAVPSDPQEWVLFTEDIVPVTDDLAVTMWKGADGSRFSYGLRLRSSGVQCERYPSYGDPAPPTWCIPSLRAHPGDGFPNDQCSGQHLAGSCGPTDVIEPTPGSLDQTLVETGSVVSPVYFVNPAESGKCTTLPPAFTSSPNPSVFYGYGSPLKLDKYPPLTMTREGSDRIRTDYLTSAGKNLFAESYYDTKYALPCSPMRLSDGGTWCVPAVIQLTLDDTSNYFADPQCTRPVALTSSSSAPQDQAGQLLRFGLVNPANASCSPNVKPTLHSFVEYQGPLFARDSGGQCTSTSGPRVLPLPAPQGYSMFEPGAAIDPSEVVAPMPVQ